MEPPVTALSDFAAAVRALAEGLRAAAVDPVDQLRLLAGLAAVPEGAPAGDAAPSQARRAGEAAAEALCRRAALTSLARASAEYQPPSYDAAVAVRDLVCGLLQAEEIRAADTGDDRTYAAFRALRTAVARDLTARGADLARLRTVTTPAQLPALVLAHRLYGSAERADELVAYSGARSPLFLPVSMRTRDR